jgi:hypothetical protein
MTDAGAPRPVPPLVLADGWDVSFYGSEEAINRQIEPWFPEDVEYRAYDSEGRKLELSVEREVVARRWLWDKTRERIAVRAVESEPRHARELAELLAQWLPMVGASPPPADTTLDELLRQAVERGDLYA